MIRCWMVLNHTRAATSDGYESGNITVTVADYEWLSLAPALAIFRENDGSITATLARSNTDIAAELNVALESSAISTPPYRNGEDTGW